MTENMSRGPSKQVDQGGAMPGQMLYVLTVRLGLGAPNETLHNAAEPWCWLMAPVAAAP